jgi:hypothetical protein
MAHRQGSKLLAPGIEKWVSADHEPAGSQLDHVCKNSLELVIGARFQDMKLDPEQVRRSMQVSQFSLGIGSGRVEEHGDVARCGYQFAQKL